MEQTNTLNRAIFILVITGLLVWAFLASGIRLGQDLQGGITLRFSLDVAGARKAGRVDSETPADQIVAQTLNVIGRRIDGYGLAEVTLNQYGDNQFLVSLPAGASAQADGIVGVITQLGDLQFRIVVKPDDQYREAHSDDPPTRKHVWPGTDAAYNKFLKDEIAKWKTARDRGEPYVPTDKRYRLVKQNLPKGQTAFHLLEEINFPGKPFDGGILTNPRKGEDPKTHQPVVLYDVKNEYQHDFALWTETNIKLPMAIVLNDEYISAPVIQDRLEKNVQVSLGYGARDKLEKEAEQLVAVLETGSLKIQPTLEARQVMGPSLAGQSRERGILATIVAFLLVLFFMLFYYRTSGLIANVALLLNIVMLVGFMALFQAVLTLPGIAGIVLTLGIAVDANILINERIREERRGGRSLRRAVAEGYDRALSAIIDANVTSLITAVFLFQFGSGPVRGFAITLAIGLIVSMFTAIFVTRTVFDALIKRGWVKEFSAFGTGEPPGIRWLHLKRLFGPLSVAGIIFGLVVFFTTDRYTLYDIDFTGGYKMQVAFKTPTTPDEVGHRLATTAKDITIHEMVLDPKTDQNVPRDVTVHVGPYPDARVVRAGEGDMGVAFDIQRLFTDSTKTEQEQALAFREYVNQLLGDRLVPVWDRPDQGLHPPEAPQDTSGDPKKEAQRRLREQLGSLWYYTWKAPAGKPDAHDPLEAFSGGVHMVIAFRDPDRRLSVPLLKSILENDMPYWVKEDGRDVAYKPAAKGLTRKVEVRPHPYDAPNISAYDIWMKSTTQGGKVVERDLKELHNRLADYLGGKPLRERLKKDLPKTEYTAVDERFGLSQPFPSENHIGSTRAEKLKNDALVALFLSLIGIIVYVAFRFRSQAMGFAAVLCLFHDVAITLGLVALANEFGLVDAKINLEMVAAFLTLVGFSVNDTVVIFDRIRENRGKRPTIDEPLIDASINQTLARTIRTTATFLLVCIALFVFNYGQRNVLEGFSFLLILGSIIGTYSTIAISTPLLLFLPWLWERLGPYAPRLGLITSCVQNVALVVLTPVAALLWLAWSLAFALVAFVVGLGLFVPWCMAGGPTRDPYARRATA